MTGVTHRLLAIELASGVGCGRGRLGPGLAVLDEEQPVAADLNLVAVVKQHGGDARAVHERAVERLDVVDVDATFVASNDGMFA